MSAHMEYDISCWTSSSGTYFKRSNSKLLSNIEFWLLSEMMLSQKLIWEIKQDRFSIEKSARYGVGNMVKLAFSKKQLSNLTIYHVTWSMYKTNLETTTTSISEKWFDGNNVISMTQYQWVIMMTNNNHLNSRLQSNCKSKELPLQQ